MSPQELNADREIGSLNGRMEAIEKRADRSESYMGEQLRLLNGKMDVLGGQMAQGIGAGRVVQFGWMLAATIFGAVMGHVWPTH